MRAKVDRASRIPNTSRVLVGHLVVERIGKRLIRQRRNGTPDHGRRRGLHADRADVNIRAERASIRDRLNVGNALDEILWLPRGSQTLSSTIKPFHSLRVSSARVGKPVRSEVL